MQFYCFFSSEYFDPYDHYAACWVTLTPGSEKGIQDTFKQANSRYGPLQLWSSTHMGHSINGLGLGIELGVGVGVGIGIRVGVGL